MWMHALAAQLQRLFRDNKDILRAVAMPDLLFYGYHVIEERIIVFLLSIAPADKESHKTRRRSPFILSSAPSPLTISSRTLLPQSFPSALSFCLKPLHSTMADTVGLASANLAAHRSSTSTSTGSSRRGSLRPAHLLGKDSELPRAVSPLGRLTRKRAATLSTERSNLSNGAEEDPSCRDTDTNGLPPTDLTREQVCLCQPDPKIPRPRNGTQYILFPL